VVDSDRSAIEVAFDGTGHSWSPPVGAPDQVSGPANGVAGSAWDPAGRLAVVTGASGLLGSAVAAELLRRDARVCLIGRDLDALRETSSSFPSGSRAALLRCDLAAADDIDSAAAFVERIGQPVDLLVHAAGLYSPSTVTHGSVDDMDEHYLLDVRGPYLLTQRLVPLLGAADGRVVFFAGPASTPPGGTGTSGDVHREVSLAGLRSFAAALRREVAPLGIGVLTVRTDEALEPQGLGGGTPGFAAECARTVVELLAGDSVEVTSVEMTSAGIRRRAERR
jgi:NAD(P)-dependent dehydrogenase (short-subunit alcohol dehydrogenase family)